MQVGEDGKPQVNTMLPFAQLQAQIQIYLAWDKAQTKEEREKGEKQEDEEHVVKDGTEKETRMRNTTTSTKARAAPGGSTTGSCGSMDVAVARLHVCEEEAETFHQSRLLQVTFPNMALEGDKEARIQDEQEEKRKPKEKEPNNKEDKDEDKSDDNPTYFYPKLARRERWRLRGTTGKPTTGTTLPQQAYTTSSTPTATINQKGSRHHITHQDSKPLP